jgi:hypothetical protein
MADNKRSAKTALRRFTRVGVLAIADVTLACSGCSTSPVARRPRADREDHSARYRVCPLPLAARPIGPEGRADRRHCNAQPSGRRDPVNELVFFIDNSLRR